MIERVKESCVGCGACAAVCPINAIEMKKNKVGFIYPEVNNRCIKCGKCLKACAEYTPIERHVGRAFYYQSEDKNILKRSTSGGAFYEIASWFISIGGVVYGCAFNQELKARHIRVDNIFELTKLQDSKYMQSDMSDVYRKIEKDLKKNIPVLFSGTPCQVAAVKRIIGVKNNLYTIDIVCHGVSSQKLFDKYLDGVESKYKCKVVSYSFRSKSNGGWSSKGEAVITRNNRQRKVLIYPSQNYYYFAFLNAHIFRPNCYGCQYADLNRVGDITLGDFWGIENHIKENVKDGFSLVLVNSEKGRNIILDAMIKAVECDILWATKENGQLDHPQQKPEFYDEIMNYMSNHTPKEIEALYKEKFRRQMFMARIKERMPYFVRIALKKVHNKWRNR